MINRRSIRILKEKIDRQIQDFHLDEDEKYNLNKELIQNYFITLISLLNMEWFAHFSQSRKEKLKENLWKIMNEEFSQSNLFFLEIKQIEALLLENHPFLRECQSMFNHTISENDDNGQLSQDKYSQYRNDKEIYGNFILNDPHIADIFEFHALLQLLRYNSINGKNLNQKKIGAFFTPISVIVYILHSLEPKILETIKTKKKIRILDYSCGMGGFILISLAYIGHLLSNFDDISTKIEFWGIDIDRYALNIADFSIKLLETHVLFKNNWKIFKFLHQDSLEPIGEKNSIFNGQNLKLTADLNPYKEEFTDFILSNPPYVSWGLGRVGKLGQEQAMRLRQIFSHSAEYKLSYYAIFIERAIQLLQNHGFVALVIPDSFLMGKYFQKLRNYILNTTLIHEIGLFQRNFWIGADSGLPVILILQKKTADEKKGLMKSRRLSFSTQKISILQDYHLAQQSFSNISGSRFRLLFSEEAKIFIKQFEQKSVPLDTCFEVHHGIRSKKGIGKNKITSKTQYGPFWKLGLISGNDVEPYKLSYRGFYINTMPKNLYSGGYHKSHIEQNKIILRRTGDRLIAAVDETGFYHTNTLLYIIPKDRKNCPMSLYELCALLNSVIFNRYYALISLKSKRTLPQVEIDMLNKIPLKLRKNSFEIMQWVGEIQMLNAKKTTTIEDKQVISTLTEFVEKNIEKLYLK